MKSAPRVLALMGACAMAAAALQGTATASSVDANMQMTSNLTARADLRSSLAPAADAVGLAGYIGPVGGNQKLVTTMTVNKTGTCTAVNKGVYQEVLTGNTGTLAASAVFIFSGCIDGAPFIDFYNCSSDLNEPCADVPAGETLAGNDKLLITITDGALNKVKVQNITQQWQSVEDGPPTEPDVYQLDDQRVAINEILVPMQNFGATKFTGTVIGGVTLKDTAPTKYNMVNEDTPPERLVTTSAIAANEKDFQLKWIQGE